MKYLKSILLTVMCVILLFTATACNSDTSTTNTAENATSVVSEDKADKVSETDSETVLRFYLVRHGQTYTNIKEMSIASAGSAPLTDQGRAYAYYVGMGLAAEDTEFLAAYCSPLNRTHETAEYILAGLGADMDITIEENVRDISWGAMEASYPEDYEELYGRDNSDYTYYFGRVDQTDFISPVEDAEPTYAFAERFEQGLLNIASQHEGETGNILVAAHSTIGFYVTKFTGEDPHGVPNTSVTIVEYKDGEFSLVEEGDTSYIENGQATYESLSELEIYLVTTPQTILQSRGVLEGGIDTDLTAEGGKAASKIASVIGDTPVAIYSSDQGRSRAALAIAYPELQDSVVETDELNDLFLGYWEAEKISLLQESDPEDLALLQSSNDILNLTPRDGEGEYPMFAASRLDGVLQEIALLYQSMEGKVVVFTHPYIIKCYLNAFYSDYEVPLSDGSQVFKLTYKDNTFTVADVTDIS